MRNLICTTILLIASIDAFAPSPATLMVSKSKNVHAPWRMSSTEEDPVTVATTATTEEPATAMVNLPGEEMSPMDAELQRQLEKQQRADELRAQEVFIQRSTGKHRCTNCNYEYDEAQGDVGTIGGMAKPGTAFADLPSNWRCPTCRAQKGAFEEIVQEIPGFEVNQGYGFGGNGLTGDEKSNLIFGGLGLFFLLFLSGYGLS